MKRRLFTILSAMSLLLFVAVVALWVRSYGVEYSVFWARERKTYHVVSFDGRIGFRALPWGVPDSPRAMSFTRAQLSAGRADRWVGQSVFGFLLRWERPEQTWRHLPGFRGGGSKSVTPPPYIVIAVPYYAITLVLLLGLMTQITRLNRLLKRGGHGLCPSCGYDLRATPGRCPECGLVPAAAPPRGNVQ